MKIIRKRIVFSRPVSKRQILLLFVLFIPLVLSISIFTFSEELLHKNYTGYSYAKSPYAAKKEILDKAVRSVSNEIIIKMIGKEKYTQNKALIDTNILSLYAKYIPLLYQKEVTKKDKVYQSTLKLSVSMETLKAILSEKGLLYERGHVPLFLPMVTFHRDKEAPFSWWSGGVAPSPQTEKAVHSFHLLLQKSFLKKGFYISRPYFFCFACNESYASRSFLFSQEMKYLASFFKSELVLTGNLKWQTHASGHLNDSDISNTNWVAGEKNPKAFYLLDWQARQAIDNKILIRIKETQEISKDSSLSSFIQSASDRMAQRLQFLWQQGRLGIKTLELLFTYPVSIQDNKKIKNSLSQIKGIKSFNEYKIDDHSMSYFVYATASSEDIARELSVLEKSSPYFQGKISHYENKIVVQAKKP